MTVAHQASLPFIPSVCSNSCLLSQWCHPEISCSVAPFSSCPQPFPLSGCFQFSSVAQSCLTLCNPMDCSTPGFPVHHQPPELTQTHVHQVGDAIQPSHPLSSSSPSFNPSQHQGLFQWVSSLIRCLFPNKNKFGEDRDVCFDHWYIPKCENSSCHKFETQAIICWKKNRKQRREGKREVKEGAKEKRWEGERKPTI